MARKRKPKNNKYLAAKKEGCDSEQCHHCAQRPFFTMGRAEGNRASSCSDTPSEEPHCHATQNDIINDHTPDHTDGSHDHDTSLTEVEAANQATTIMTDTDQYIDEVKVTHQIETVKEQAEKKSESNVLNTNHAPTIMRAIISSTMSASLGMLQFSYAALHALSYFRKFLSGPELLAVILSIGSLSAGPEMEVYYCCTDSFLKSIFRNLNPTLNGRTIFEKHHAQECLRQDFYNRVSQRHKKFSYDKAYHEWIQNCLAEIQAQDSVDAYYQTLKDNDEKYALSCILVELIEPSESCCANNSCQANNDLNQKQSLSTYINSFNEAEKKRLHTFFVNEKMAIEENKQQDNLTKSISTLRAKKVFLYTSILFALSAFPAVTLGTTHAFLETLIHLNLISDTTVAPSYIWIIAAIAAIGFVFLTINTLHQIIVHNTIGNTFKKIAAMNKKKKIATIFAMIVIATIIIFGSVFTFGMMYKLSVASLPQLLAGQATLIPKIMTAISLGISITSQAIFSFTNTLAGLMTLSWRMICQIGKRWFSDTKQSLIHCTGQYGENTAKKRNLASTVLFFIPTTCLSLTISLLTKICNAVIMIAHCLSIGIGQAGKVRSNYALTISAALSIAATDAGGCCMFCMLSDNQPQDTIKPSLKPKNKHVMIAQRLIYGALYLPHIINCALKSSMHQDAWQTQKKQIRQYERVIGNKVGKWVVFGLITAVGIALIAVVVGLSMASGAACPAAFASMYLKAVVAHQATLIAGISTLTTGAASLITTQALKHTLSDNSTCSSACKAECTRTDTTEGPCKNCS